MKELRDRLPYSIHRPIYSELLKLLKLLVGAAVSTCNWLKRSRRAFIMFPGRVEVGVGWSGSFLRFSGEVTAWDPPEMPIVG